MSNNIEFEFRGKRYRDAEAGLRAFAKDIGKSLDGAGKVVERELRDYLETVAEALAQRHGNPWPGGTTDSSLSKRSGRGIQSIRDSIKVTGGTLDNVQGQIGAPGYMAIHETGGVIKAKRSKYLTIPLPAALNADGTPKKRSARQWRNTFVATSKKGNLLIFQRRGAGIVPLYALKTQVTIKPRLKLKETLDAGLPYFVDKTFDALMREIRSA